MHFCEEYFVEIRKSGGYSHERNTKRFEEKSPWSKLFTKIIPVLFRESLVLRSFVINQSVQVLKSDLAVHRHGIRNGWRQQLILYFISWKEPFDYTVQCYPVLAAQARKQSRKIGNSKWNETPNIYEAQLHLYTIFFINREIQEKKLNIF